MTRMIFSALLLMISGSVLADVLIMDEVRQVEKMNLPANGQNMAAVESSFGTPEKKHEAVGEPPITRWDYKTYSVYFEHDLVLFSVLHPGQAVNQS